MEEHITGKRESRGHTLILHRSYLHLTFYADEGESGAYATSDTINVVIISSEVNIPVIA